MYSKTNSPWRWKLSALILLMLLFACEEPANDPEPEEETPFEVLEAFPEDTTTYTDEELQQVLDEEIEVLKQIEAGRIVDVSGMHVPKENPKLVFVHYMPWFQSKDYDGYWGQHWTMTNQNPDIMDENGRRQIASHYYPLIGPYSSSDPDLHEYHFLMMRLAGIDGVIFDWYGSRDLYDYSLIKQGTETFIDQLEDLGLDFSIMYEDRVAVQAVEQGLANSPIEAAQEDFAYIRDTYFTSPNYTHFLENEVLYVFGPHHLTNSTEWDEVFSIFPEGEKPDFLTLWAAQNQVGESASGEFVWVAPDHMLAHEHYYHVYPENNKITVGGAYPGFDSFYLDGGWGNHGWSISQNGGHTFAETLTYTHHEVADFIQLITWNDFGEGTMIEPTDEFGFMYLQLLQQYTGVEFDPNDLQVALDLYHARKRYEDDAFAQSLLDRVYANIKELKLKRRKANPSGIGKILLIIGSVVS